MERTEAIADVHEESAGSAATAADFSSVAAAAVVTPQTALATSDLGTNYQNTLNVLVHVISESGFLHACALLRFSETCTTARDVIFGDNGHYWKSMYKKLYDDARVDDFCARDVAELCVRRYMCLKQLLDAKDRLKNHVPSRPSIKCAFLANNQYWLSDKRWLESDKQLVSTLRGNWTVDPKRLPLVQKLAQVTRNGRDIYLVGQGTKIMMFPCGTLPTKLVELELVGNPTPTREAEAALIWRGHNNDEAIYVKPIRGEERFVVAEISNLVKEVLGITDMSDLQPELLDKFRYFKLLRILFTAALVDKKGFTLVVSL